MVWWETESEWGLPGQTNGLNMGQSLDERDTRITKGLEINRRLNRQALVSATENFGWTGMLAEFWPLSKQTI